MMQGLSVERQPNKAEHHFFFMISGIALFTPTPKLGIILSITPPSQTPLPFMSRYQVPLEKTPILEVPVLSQSPVTGITLGTPTPKLGITLSATPPSQTPSPFMSRYQEPLEKTPILVTPVPFQSPVTGIALG